ncbi:MAG: hypothetical protein ACK521_11980, partial [bacterium]
RPEPIHPHDEETKGTEVSVNNYKPVCYAVFCTFLSRSTNGSRSDFRESCRKEGLTTAPSFSRRVKRNSKSKVA